MPQPHCNPKSDENQASPGDLALTLAGLGWYVHPCKADKTPLTKWKTFATTDPETIRAWWKRWPGALIGICAERSGFFALDIDCKGENGFYSLADLIDQAGQGAALLPLTGPAQTTPSGGAHYFYRLPEDLKVPNNAGQLAPGLDLRCAGYVCNGPGYAWLPGHGPEIPLTEAPAWLLAEIAKMTTKKAPGASTMPPVRNNGQNTTESGKFWLEKALRQAVPGARNHVGFWLACQLRDSGLTQAEAEAILADYAAQVPGEGYTDREASSSCREAYKAGRRDPAREAGSAIFRGNGNHPQAENFHGNSQAGGALKITDPTPGFFRLDDIGNGERLTHRHGWRLRYVKEWGWLVWTAKTWEPDRGQVASMAKETARSILAEAAAVEDDEKSRAVAKHANATANHTRRAAMIEAAASEPGIPARPQDFDGDPWLLNCQNGTLNLQTAELQPHSPQGLVTKICGASYDPGAACPRWLAFLDKNFNDDHEKIGFIQRSFGYSLTGNVGEQCLFDLYGLGKNGKSVFTGILQAVLGDYSQKTPSDTLMLKYYDNGIPNDLARLAGARAVIAAELSEGKRLNESIVKDLTGGDVIAARYLHREFFEFRPQFKLWLYGNHKPVIGGTDEGIWRRIKLIPFIVVIPENERDPNLLEKLRGELPGILAWAVRGCKEWQREGLKTPASIDAATAAYRAEQDTLSAFFEACCILQPGAKAAAGALFESYKSWGGELKQRRFSQTMAERGYVTQGRDAAGRALYHGIGLIEAVDEPEN